MHMQFCQGWPGEEVLGRQPWGAGRRCVRRRDSRTGMVDTQAPLCGALPHQGLNGFSCFMGAYMYIYSILRLQSTHATAPVTVS